METSKCAFCRIQYFDWEGFDTCSEECQRKINQRKGKRKSA